MRILYVTGREKTYARNDVLLRALRRFAQVTVVAPSQAPDSLVAASAQMAASAARLLATQPFDLVFVGFYGYLILEAIRPLVRVPLLFDAFVSNYDTLVLDRATIAENSLQSRVALWIDRSATARADHVLVDTPAHVDYFADEIGVARARMSAVPVGCNEEIFAPRPSAPHDGTRVLYYCTYMPLHGVDVVLHAASYLAALPVQFRIVGDGSLRPAMTALAEDLRLANVCFLEPLTAAAIASELAECDVCLGGHFGPSDKAQRTVPGKVYQMLCAERAVVAVDSPANRWLLENGISALLVPPQNPAELALAILRLHGDAALRQAFASGGRSAFVARASEAVITAQLREITGRMITA